MEETIPCTPVIREVRIGSGSDRFNPRRGEIDITQPFEFDGRGGSSCVPFKIRDYNDGVRELDIQRMEKQAAKLEKDLIIKELETLDFLESLASTKKVIEDLKLELHQRSARCIKSPKHLLHSQAEEINNKEEDCYRNPLPSPDQSEAEKEFLGVASLAEELNSLRFNTDKLPSNPQREDVKMVTEINDTTFHEQGMSSLRTIEMRLLAPRKMEEAAKAAEALAVAEMKHFPEPPRTPLTLEAHLKEDLYTEFSRTEIIRKLEEANEEVKQSKQALEMALNRVEIASLKQLEAEDAFRQWNIESWKDQKAMRRAKGSGFKGDSFPRRRFLNQQEPVIDLPKPVLKRNVSIGNVLNRKQVPIVDEKQFVSPKRKFRFIHIKVPLEKQTNL